MTDTSAAGERFDFGRVVGQTFGLIGRNFVAFTILALFFVGIPRFAYTALQGTLIQTRPDMAGWVILGGTLFSLITSYILQGALTRASVDDLSGRGAQLGAALADGLRFFFPLFIVALLVGLGLFVGFLLLIVPGIILAVRWAVAAPVAVIEREGPTN